MLPINNVLLVDDDPLINMINEQIIQMLKFPLKVGSYLNANEALGYLKRIVKTDRTKFPKVMFLDLNMPEMDGWEFLDELNKFPASVLKECKIFMLTSSIDQADINKSKGYKMINEFIAKPLTVDKLEILFSPQHLPVSNLN